MPMRCGNFMKYFLIFLVFSPLLLFQTARSAVPIMVLAAGRGTGKGLDLANTTGYSVGVLPVTNFEVALPLLREKKYKGFIAPIPALRSLLNAPEQVTLLTTTGVYYVHVLAPLALPNGALLRSVTSLKPSDISVTTLDNAYVVDAERLFCAVKGSPSISSAQGVGCTPVQEDDQAAGRIADFLIQNKDGQTKRIYVAVLTRLETENGRDGLVDLELTNTSSRLLEIPKLVRLAMTQPPCSMAPPYAEGRIEKGFSYANTKENLLTAGYGEVLGTIGRPEADILVFAQEVQDQLWGRKKSPKQAKCPYCDTPGSSTPEFFQKHQPFKGIRTVH